MEIDINYFHSHEQLFEALRIMNEITAHQTNYTERGHILEREIFRKPFPAHPLTCGSDSNHAPLYPYWTGEKVILMCRDCDYVQMNCAGFDDQSGK